MEIWMKAHGSMYTHALVTDTRDVVFQLDPFDWSGIIQKPPQDKRGNPEPMIIGDKLYAFKEHLGITLATHDINRKWVEGAFGESGLNRIGGWYPSYNSPPPPRPNKLSLSSLSLSRVCL